MASADVATAKAKATLINNLIIVSSYLQPDTRRKRALEREAFDGELVDGRMQKVHRPTLAHVG